MPLISAEAYREFGLPYLKRIADTFGGALIHCCGQYGHQVQNLCDLHDGGIPIRAMEFHDPYTSIDEVRPLGERGVVLKPYLGKNGLFANNVEYYRWLLENTPYRYWFALFDGEEDHAFARELEEREVAAVC